MHVIEPRGNFTLEVNLPSGQSLRALERALADMAAVDRRGITGGSIAGEILLDHVFGVAAKPRETLIRLYDKKSPEYDMRSAVRDCLRTRHGLPAAQLTPVVETYAWVLGRHNTKLQPSYTSPTGKRGEKAVVARIEKAIDDFLKREGGNSSLVKEARLWKEGKMSSLLRGLPAADIVCFLGRIMSEGAANESCPLALENAILACEPIPDTAVERLALSDAIVSSWEDVVGCREVAEPDMSHQHGHESRGQI